MKRLHLEIVLFTQTGVSITCSTFGVLTLLLRCLPLAVSASFTVTAYKERRRAEYVSTITAQCFPASLLA